MNQKYEGDFKRNNIIYHYSKSDDILLLDDIL